MSQCSILNLSFGSDVVSQNSVAYTNFTYNYWSLQQSEIDPKCIFEPTTSAQVSVLVLISRLTKGAFAVRSGGHAAFEGASNIEGGITLSFAKTKSITIAADNKTATLQPGNRWGDVYKYLANYDLAAIGGRVYNIGVGGLTLGGGISFFSNIHGWACDHVASYDVVTASGTEISVSPTKHPDLYWALRGGANNFGIVVAFHSNLISLPGNEMWGGTRAFLENTFTSVATAFSNLIANSPSDPNAGQWVAWLSSNGTKLAATEFWYAKPDGGKAANWNEYDNITFVSDTTQNRKLYEYAAEIELSSPYHLREVYYGLTTKANNQVAAQAYPIFYEGAAALANVSGAMPVLLYQGITKGQVAGMSKNGGNPLGLSTAEAPYYLIHVACWWTHESDDTLVYSTVSDILTKIKAMAASVGADNDYVYMNYASNFEDVIRSYGAANKAKLKSIATKYDPTGVFQTLQPGYFKLDRPPVISNYFSG